MMSKRLSRVLSRVGNNESVQGMLFVLPIVVMVVGLIAYPVGRAFTLSLQNKVIGSPAQYVGLRNFRDMILDPLFRTAAWHTLVYTLCSISGKLLFGMVLALLLNNSFRARTAIRAIVLLPWIVPTFISALTWRWIYDGTAGVLNFVLLGIGVIHENVAWLSRTDLALPAVIGINIWRGTAFFGVTLLAGMQSVPSERYDACKVEGGGALQGFFRVTLPGVVPVLSVATILSTIWTFNDFQIIWITTHAGPVNATQVLATLAYQYAFVILQLSRGVAVSMIMFPVLFALIVVLLAVLRRREKEN